MADNEEKIDIIEKTHTSKLILDSLRHKFLQGERRSDFIEGMNHSYEEEEKEDITIRRSTRRSTIAPSDFIEKYNINPKIHFKSLVHLLMIHLFWKHASDKKSADEENFAAKVRLIHREKSPESILTYQEKMLLTKHPIARTEEDIQTLAKAFCRMKHFKALGSDSIQQLAKTAEFSCFGPNRKVMKKNAPATGMYLITSGEVSTLFECIDPMTLSYCLEPVGTIGPGEVLGEVSLIYDIPRISTIVTMAVCEMVFWNKRIFKDILLETFLDESNKIMQILKKLPYFEDFSENALRVCSCKSYIQNYPKDSVIRASDFGKKYFVHIMLKGECHLIQRLDLVQGMNAKGKLIFPYMYNGQDLPPGHTVVTWFFNIASYSRGMVFNLDESWKNRMLMAHTDVEIFLIPIELVKEYGSKSTSWNQIRNFLKDQLPNEKEIYDEYCEEMKLVKQKEKMLKNIYENKHS